MLIIDILKKKVGFVHLPLNSLKREFSETIR